MIETTKIAENTSRCNKFIKWQEKIYFSIYEAEFLIIQQWTVNEIPKTYFQNVYVFEKIGDCYS